MAPMTLEKLRQIYLECGLAHAEFCVDQAIFHQSRESLNPLYSALEDWERAEYGELIRGGPR